MKKFLFILMIYFCFISNVFAKDLRFIQISDVNYSKSDDNSTFSKLIDSVNKQIDVDFVVFTGDNIKNPNQKDLEAFIKEAKKLKVPFYVVIGDRDVNRHKDLSKKQYAAILKRKLHNARYADLNYTFEKKGFTFIVVDGAKDVIPSTNGYYKDNILEWVEANLKIQKKQNVIILQHFPIIPPVDKEGYVTLKPEKYLSILNNHKNVKAVVAGHFGVNDEKDINGIMHITTAPAPYYRIIDIFDCNSKNPQIWAQIKEVQ